MKEKVICSVQNLKKDLVSVDKPHLCRKYHFYFYKTPKLLYLGSIAEFCLKANNEVIWGLCSQNSSRLFWDSKRLVQYHTKKKSDSFSTIKACHYLSYPGYFFNNMPWVWERCHLLFCYSSLCTLFPFSTSFNLPCIFFFSKRTRVRVEKINFLFISFFFFQIVL